MFRDGDELELGSRNDRPLTRYFPELVELLLDALPERCVVDGEIVVVTESGLDFDTLQHRLHPAESRVRKLAEETPASFVAFDLLALDDRDLTGEPFAERRRLLEGVLDGRPRPGAPHADDRRPRRWPRTGSPASRAPGFDGVMAKPADQPYQQDKRVMWKVKHERTADCVVAGFRWHKDGEGVGSLLLGLFDDEGTLHHVGVASSFTAARRRELVDELAPLRERRARRPPVARVGRRGRRRQGRRAACRAASAAGTRRRTCRGSRSAPSWWPRSATSTCSAGRFRHGGRLVRFRPDRTPESCTYAQLEEVAPAELADIFLLTGATGSG